MSNRIIVTGGAGFIGSAVVRMLIEHGLAFNDPALGIAWPFPPERLTLSDKDRQLPRLADLTAGFE